MQKEVKLLMSPEAYAIAREAARQEGFTCVGTMIRRDVERFYIGRAHHGKAPSEKSGPLCAQPAESTANPGSQQCANVGSHNSCCTATSPSNGDAPEEISDGNR